MQTWNQVVATELPQTEPMLSIRTILSTGWACSNMTLVEDMDYIRAEKNREAIA